MGSNTSARVGSQGRSEINKLFPEQVLGIWQAGHFLHGKVPEKRYDLADPEMQGLCDSIKTQGWLQPGEVWFFEDTQTAHVVFGNRRTYATAYVNGERLEAGQEEVAGSYRVVLKKALTPALIAEAMERYGDENNRRKGNDWLTVAHAVAQKLKLGVPVGSVLASWPMIESETMLLALAADDGVRAAHSAVQDALAAGEIPVKRAMRIAKLPLAEQVAAMEGKQAEKASKPSAVPVTKLRKLYDDMMADKGLHGLSGVAVVAVLMGGPPQSPEEAKVKALITAKSKPGRKPKPTADGLTQTERDDTQAFLDAEATKRAEKEAEEAKRKEKRS